VVKEMTRVTRPGGPRRAARPGLRVDRRHASGPRAHREDPRRRRRAIYAEPHSGRRLGALLRAAGLADVKMIADVYQDTTLTQFSRNFLGRRAENAVRFGIVDAPTAERWLDGFNALARRGQLRADDAVLRRRRRQAGAGTAIASRRPH